MTADTSADAMEGGGIGDSTGRVPGTTLLGFIDYLLSAGHRPASAARSSWDAALAYPPFADYGTPCAFKSACRAASKAGASSYFRSIHVDGRVSDLSCKRVTIVSPSSHEKISCMIAL